ncbi:MAG: PAS domain S-box protein [Methyloprofundus sp.]|nr:PAS domain S-box protein [Methyloprofundus sp.]
MEDDETREELELVLQSWFNTSYAAKDSREGLAGNISYVNSQFCHLSGYTEAKLLGQHYLFTFAEND